LGGLTDSFAQAILNSPSDLPINFLAADVFFINTARPLREERNKESIKEGRNIQWLEKIVDDYPQL
jgi:hypothetical protein